MGKTENITETQNKCLKCSEHSFQGKVYLKGIQTVEILVISEVVLILVIQKLSFI